MKIIVIIFYKHITSIYLSERKIVYSFRISGFLRLIVDIEGLSKFLMIIFGFIGKSLNNNVMIYKQIRNLYFVKNKSHETTTRTSSRESDLFYKEL